MSLFNRLRRVPREPQIKVMAEQIAARARHSVWQRICGRIPSMTSNEARGYIRARAAAVISREVEFEFSQRQRVRATTRERVTELTSEIIIRVMLSQSRVVQPAVVPVRKAA